MYGDFSRLTHQPAKHYSAVLAQQGRVQLDADANEQAAIELFRSRTLARDLIGRDGGPAGTSGDGPGFRITYVRGSHDQDDLTIGGGRYYVDGIQLDATCPQPPLTIPAGGLQPLDGGSAGADRDGVIPSPTPATWTYWNQPDAYRDPELQSDQLPSAFPFLAYLKVWDRSVTAVEDPEIREVALGAAMPDTAARVKTVWQVLTLPAQDLDVGDGGAATVRAAFDEWVAAQRSTARLAARAERPEGAADEPCLVRPDARYRGPENQLYRIEIHQGGTAERGATFKWSRENGSVAFPIAELDGTWVALSTLGDDDKLTLDVGDRVEVCDSAYISRGEPAPLLSVAEIDLPGRRVRLSAEPLPGIGALPERHPFLRRWDHASTGTPGHRPRTDGGALPVEEGTWLELEDGLQVYFNAGGSYRSGDFWLIPTRTVTGAVEWPANSAGDPLLQLPLGIDVHYAPLAWITGENSLTELRRVFHPLATPLSDAHVDPQEN
ncbi:DUF6519 domain-containing protein [Streptomyces sp. NPDC059680]|uniref:DUF6519 domain-containing protein n=1 Tax=Streptomyces sp. NPDC059680 TaxID=3346904 RepID=UPI0036BE1358